MFYAHFVLAKKGPLARIWLAAHWDKKLTKAQVYETNIEESVVSIMQPKVKMALRTSGHLLLGVVRIYSRKTKYLLADCNEAFAKIKMAFRPGMVDLPLDKREAAINAITLPDFFSDLDTEIPSIEDMVDIDGQFVFNQTRADEITMREDYGAMLLNEVGVGGGGVGRDGGFYSSGGGVSLDTPEVLRDAVGQQAVRSLGGGDGGRRATTSAGSDFGSTAGISLDQDISRLRDLPQADDSSIGGRPSIDLEVVSKEIELGPPDLPELTSTGGMVLEEGGLTFGSSVREPPPPSPLHSEAGDQLSRGPSPLEDTGLQPGLEEPLSLAPPTLDQTPASPSLGPAAAQQPQHHDQTTLLQNEDESFALAPVEASALRGEKRKRKRRLVVDIVKAFSGEEMKEHLNDISDIITTLDIAPPTKRLMLWKEVGGVDELFSLPCHPLPKGRLSAQYKKGLRLHRTDDDNFTFIRDQPGHDLQLENIEQGRRSPVKNRPTKRKRVEDRREESLYAKRQQELVRQQEQMGREIRGEISVTDTEEASFVETGVEVRQEGEEVSLEMRREVSLEMRGEVSLEMRGDSINLQEKEVVRGETISLQNQEENLQQISGFEDRLGASDFSGLPLETLPQTPYFPASPGAPCSPGLAPSPLPNEDFDGPPSPPGGYGSPAPLPEEDIDQDGGHLDVAPGDETGAEPTEAVAQGQDMTRSREEDSQMMDDESQEAYEDRVLNKRAAMLHKVLEVKFSEHSEVDMSSLVSERSSKKHAAQAFYSFLVLSKHDAIIGAQDSIFAPILLTKSAGFSAALQKL